MIPCLDSENIVRIDVAVHGDARWHRLGDHLHSFTSVFDPPERRMGLTIEEREETGFHVSGEPFDACIKLTGLWLAYSAIACPFRLLVNGTEVWSGTLQMPRVCAGWPSAYWHAPSGCLKSGWNSVVVETSGTPLLVNELTVFARMRTGAAIEVLHSPRVLTVGREFWVTLLAYEPVGGLNVEHGDCVELVSSPEDVSVGEVDFFFRAVGVSASPRVSFVMGDERLDIDLPPILDLPEGLPCHVGTDSDDHRQDDTGLMEQLLSYLFRSETGDLVMFRPKQQRNCIVWPSAEMCRSWLAICRRYHARYLACEWGPDGEFPPEIHEEMASDPAFVGYHMHEPYFVMFEPMANEAIRKAADFQERRDAYMAEMRRYVDRYHSLGGRAACGEASWLVAYDGEAGFDILNIEIVAGAGPHLGAARGAMRGRPEVALGHHIAIEWYLGYPYDDLKSHRFWLMMLLTFTHGGQYIYAENSLFFTNSYERYDPEDVFPTRNRELMRRFYDMSRLQPRFGEPCAELAVAYGNLESMLWHQDDALPEMDDASEWGSLLWNKWKGELYKPCMRAMDAWLPPVEIERYHVNRTILKWFSGNPYGNVDMVSVERPADVLSQYRVLAFLGWNTMTPEALAKLREYVKGGGTLLIAGCHFDRRTIPGGEYEIDTAGAEDLLGLAVKGYGGAVGDVSWMGESYPAGASLRTCDIEIRGAEVVARDSNGAPVLLRNSFGAGEVFFYNFWDHPASQEALALTQGMMRFLGEKHRSEFGMDEAYGVNCQHWHDPKADIHRLYLVNVNWMKPRTSRACKVRLWGRGYPVNVDRVDPLVVAVKGRIAVIPDSPSVFVEDIVIDGHSCRVRLVGVGRHCVRVICADSAVALSSDGESRGSECTAMVDLSGTAEIELLVGGVSDPD